MISSAFSLTECEAWLFALNFAIMFTNCLVMPVRESLILHGGKALQTKLMFYSPITSTIGTSIFSSLSSRYGGHVTLQIFFIISLCICLITWLCNTFITNSNDLIPSIFYHYFTFYNMTCMSTFWVVAGDVLAAVPSSHTSKPKGKQFIKSFGKFAAGGTLGQLIGSSLSGALSQSFGTTHSLLVVGMFFAFTGIVMRGVLIRYSPPYPHSKENTSTKIGSQTTWIRHAKTLVSELYDVLSTFCFIWDDQMLRYSLVYSVLLSTALGLFVVERQQAAATMAKDDYASLVAMSLTLQGAVQFCLQYWGTAALTNSLGSRLSCSLSAVGRLTLFTGILAIQTNLFPLASAWYTSGATSVLVVLLVGDISCRILNQVASKPLKESLWSYVPLDIKYRAKIIIDVFAHRIGTSLAALLSNINLGLETTTNGERAVGNQAIGAHILWGTTISVVYVIVAVGLGACIDGRSDDSVMKGKKVH